MWVVFFVFLFVFWNKKRQRGEFLHARAHAAEGAREACVCLRGDERSMGVCLRGDTSQACVCLRGEHVETVSDAGDAP